MELVKKYATSIVCLTFILFFTFGSSQEREESDDYIVTIKAGRQFSEQAKAAMSKIGAPIRQEMNIGKLRFLITKIPAKVLEKMQNIPGVLNVQRNAKVYTTVPVSTADGFENVEEATTQNYTYCLEQDAGTELWGLARVVRRGEKWTPDDNRTSHEDPAAGKYTYSTNDDGDGVAIYVVDSGILTNHRDMGGRATSDFTSSELRSEGDSDKNGHGTHVAGSAGGNTYGIAKRAKLKSIKVLGANGRGTTIGVLEGLAFILNQYQDLRNTTGKRPKFVVNMSLGSAGGINPMNDALREMAGEGVIIVVAAGNAADDACHFSPANVAEAITVGATNRLDRLADFSNYGPCVDILAPGVDILSAVSLSPTASDLFSGTSMASPHVAGMVARYIQGFDEPPSPAEIKEWLWNTSTAGVVNVTIGQSHSGITTDRLLYKDCITDDYESTEPPTEEDSPKEVSDGTKTLYYLTVVIPCILAGIGSI